MVFCISIGIPAIIELGRPVPKVTGIGTPLIIVGVSRILEINTGAGAGSNLKSTTCGVVSISVIVLGTDTGMILEISTGAGAGSTLDFTTCGVAGESLKATGVLVAVAATPSFPVMAVTDEPIHFQSRYTMTAKTMSERVTVPFYFD